MRVFFRSKYIETKSDGGKVWISKTHVRPTDDSVVKGKWQKKKAKRERMARLNESRS